MSLVHSLSTDTSTFNLHAPPPSQDALMYDLPDVFVIPPEEEHDENPPWCAFDAAKAAEGTMYMGPDIDDLEAALDMHRQTDNRAPRFHRLANHSQETILLPKKGRARSHDIAMGVDTWRRQDIRARILDAEIVEVVKVRRNEGMSDVGDGRNMGLKKSKTFRARASQAFKSIKNVGKGPRKATLTDAWPAAEDAIRTARSMDITDAQTSPRPGTPNLTRRKSLQLSQIFTFTQSGKSSVRVADISSPTMPPVTQSSTMSPTESTFSNDRQLRTPTSIEESTEDLSLGGRMSPVPTLQRKKSFRQRLSIMDLQRLFSSSSNSPSPSSTSSSSSSDLSELSTAESAGVPATPRMDDDMFSHANSQPPSFIFKDSASPHSATPPVFTAVHGESPSTFDDARDISLEMKLDSLHFDSLRFDPDDF